MEIKALEEFFVNKFANDIRRSAKTVYGNSCERHLEKPVPRFKTVF